MIPLESISLIGGALSGFVMKAWAQKAQDEKEKFDRMMNAIDKSNESSDLAVKRVPNDKNGNIIRRIIVLLILANVVLFPFILSLLEKRSIIQIDLPIKEHLMGLFSTGGKTVFYDLHSYLISSAAVQGLFYILGFYFGQSAMKRD